MIDVITQWCVFNDYPLFRLNIENHRSRFNKVILYPSRHHGVVDLESFAREVFPETWVNGHTIDWTTPDIDWRQAETEPCLELSDAEWVLFMEQDFFVDDWDVFFEMVDCRTKFSDMIGWWNETEFPYVHPCFLLIKRELLERTKKDFRAHPEIPGCDHFAMITNDVQELGGKISKLQEMGYTNWENAFHVGGLTYPYQNWKGDGTDIIGVASPEAFMVYNYFSRHAPTELDPKYLKLSEEIEKYMISKYPILKMEDNHWVKFFKI